MASKPADLGEKCYLYDTFGKCQYGVTCRFAKAHTGPDFKNLVNEDVFQMCKDRTPVKNSLDKDLQWRLRKRKVPFKETEAYLKTISKGKPQEGNKTTAAAVKGSAEGCCPSAAQTHPAEVDGVTNVKDTEVSHRQCPRPWD